MIAVNDEISISEREIQLDFIHSGGPGGQNVNKVATAVQLRFDISKSRSISVEIKDRLIQLAGKKVTEDGVIVINAKAHRTQERNRKDAVDRLVKLILKASKKPKIRKPTKPTRLSKLQRLENKKIRSKLKETRQSVHDSEY